MAISSISNSFRAPSLPSASLNRSSGAGQSQFNKDVASLSADLKAFNSGKGHQVEEAQGATEAGGEAGGEQGSIQELLGKIVKLLEGLLQKLGGATQGQPEGGETTGAPQATPPAI